MHNTVSRKDRGCYSLSPYWGENLLEMQFSAFTRDLPDQKPWGGAVFELALQVFLPYAQV